MFYYIEITTTLTRKSRENNPNKFQSIKHHFSLNSLCYPTIIRGTIQTITHTNSICNNAIAFNFEKLYIELLNG